MRFKIFFGGLMLMILFILCSCGAYRFKEGQLWLISKEGKPEINVSGNWNCQVWGDTILKQTNGQVTGNIDEYQIIGTVSGRNVYILMYNRDFVDYFIQLKSYDQDTLVGFYSKYRPAGDINSYFARGMTFTRVK